MARKLTGGDGVAVTIPDGGRGLQGAEESKEVMAEWYVYIKEKKRLKTCGEE